MVISFQISGKQQIWTSKVFLTPCISPKQKPVKCCQQKTFQANLNILDLNLSFVNWEEFVQNYYLLVVIRSSWAYYFHGHVLAFLVVEHLWCCERPQNIKTGLNTQHNGSFEQNQNTNQNLPHPQQHLIQFVLKKPPHF